MSERLCRACGNWHDLEQPWPGRCCKPQPALSNLPFPQVMSDTMDPVQSMVTGAWHTSKRGIRAEYKQHNVVEVGDDPNRLKPRKKPKRDERQVREVVDRAAARFERGERA